MFRGKRGPFFVGKAWLSTPSRTITVGQFATECRDHAPLAGRRNFESRACRDRPRTNKRHTFTGAGESGSALRMRFYLPQSQSALFAFSCMRPLLRVYRQVVVIGASRRIPTRAKSFAGLDTVSANSKWTVSTAGGGLGCLTFGRTSCAYPSLAVFDWAFARG